MPQVAIPQVDDARAAQATQSRQRSGKRRGAEQQIRALHRFIAQLDTLNRALLLLYLEDQSYREIAEILGLSEHTINHYLNRATKKLDAVNRTQAVAKALRLGLIK